MCFPTPISEAPLLSQAWGNGASDNRMEWRHAGFISPVFAESGRMRPIYATYYTGAGKCEEFAQDYNVSVEESWHLEIRVLKELLLKDGFRIELHLS